MAESVLYRQEAGVAHLTFNRPDRLNAVDPTLASGFLAAIQRGLADPSVRVFVLSGAGRAFMAGGDLAYFRDAGESAGQAAWALIGPLHEAIRLMSASDAISISAIHGACAGGGMSLALSTDLAIAAEDARFNMAYLGVAATPDCSGSWNLVRQIGLRRALGLVLTGETIDAGQAEALGLINRVAPPEALLEQATALALKLANGPQDAIAGAKHLLRAAGDASLEAQLVAEASSFAARAASSDFREALSAFFERRTPEFAKF